MSEQNLDRSAAFNAAIMLHCMEMREMGGPTPEQWARLEGIGDLLGGRGDVLLFGGGRKGEASDLFNKACFSVACLSFLPGGITFMGERYESKVSVHE